MWPFDARCPVDPETRAWVDARMEWLAKEFGMDLWWTAPAIEPIDAFFPARFDGSEHSARVMLDQICSYMGVDPERIILRLYSDDRNHQLALGILIKTDTLGSAGTYSVDEKETVSIEASNLSEPACLVATMAHELAHARLLGENRISREEEDHEPTTDLATVFFGLGIFNANAVAQFKQWSSHGGCGWQSKRLGYLDEPTFGYALGVWAYVRGEIKPKWMRHLRIDPRSVMAKTLRYLDANENPFKARRRPNASR